MASENKIAFAKEPVSLNVAMLGKSSLFFVCFRSICCVSFQLTFDLHSYEMLYISGTVLYCRSLLGSRAAPYPTQFFCQLIYKTG